MVGLLVEMIFAFAFWVIFHRFFNFAQLENRQKNSEKNEKTKGLEVSENNTKIIHFPKTNVKIKKEISPK